jgi:hypothetical protein
MALASSTSQTIRSTSLIPTKSLTRSQSFLRKRGPYGRIVAIAEAAPSNDSEDERTVIRKNRAIVAGTLQSMQVLIHWVPKT